MPRVKWVDEKAKQISSIFSQEHHILAPQWWKDIEYSTTVPASFEMVFPLKRAYFDGIEVYVPNQTKKYLQRIYGQNIDPVKVYDETTCRYEKDLSHPYWQESYAH